MEQHIWELITGILLASNGAWFFFLKAERKKRNAEAKGFETETNAKDFILQKDQYDFLLEKLNKFQNDYVTLADRFNEATNNHINEMISTKTEFNEKINQKCNEIASLKSKITFYRGFRCYRAGCEDRDQTYKKEDNEDK